MIALKGHRWKATSNRDEKLDPTSTSTCPRGGQVAFLGGNKRLRTGFRPGPLDVSLYRICTYCIAKNLDIHGLNRDGYKKPPKTHLRQSVSFPLHPCF
jgi:hypothetical protein